MYSAKNTQAKRRSSVRSANKKNKGYTFINNLIEEVEVLSGEKEAYSIKLKKGFNAKARVSVQACECC